MCSTCKGMRNVGSHTAPNECPIAMTRYCSFCCRKGHTTPKCPNGVLQWKGGSCADPNLEELYHKPMKPVLEVVDDQPNIRAFLLAYGITLSGKNDVNRQNLVDLARNLDPPLELYWIDKKTGEYRLHVDGVTKKKRTKNS